MLLGSWHFWEQKIFVLSVVKSLTANMNTKLVWLELVNIDIEIL